MVLDNGTYWILYSIPNVSAVMGGFVQGTGTSLNGSFASADAIDFNVEGRGITTATLSAGYGASQNFSGSVTYPGLNQAYSFTTSYDAAYGQAPNLSAVAGTYTGVASTLNSNQLTTIAIRSSGVVVGTDSGGCSFIGAAVPRAKGNLYDLSLVFGGGSCSHGTSALTGIGYIDSSGKRLYTAALNSARTDGLVFVGVKP